MKAIIDLLNSDNHYGISERVEIAKGKYEYIIYFYQFKIKLKRLLKYGRGKNS